MTKDEFKIIVKGLKAVYTDPKFIPDEAAFNVWYALLKDFEYKSLETSVMSYMMTNKFPPTIADLRKQAVKIADTSMNGEEAWAKVLIALRNSAYGYKEEYDKLSPETQKAIGSAESLREMALDENFNHGVMKSNFLRSYAAVMEQTKELSLLPERMRERLSQTTERLGITQNG